MMPDRKILLITYYFPPLGMGGVGRPYALFRRLPEYGYEVTVLTVKDISYHEYDYSRLKPEDESKIVRSGSYDPSRILHLLGIKKGGLSGSGAAKAPICYYPDSKRGWVGPARRKAGRLLTDGHYDAIITTSPPPSVHLIGLKLRKSFNVPWISDFRDFWFSKPIEMIYGTSLQKKYALRLKSRVIESADAIIGVNESIIHYLGRGEVITNGSDMETGYLWQGRKPERESRLTIGVLGTINHLCPIEPLFKAVAALIDADKQARDRIKIIHVGEYDKDMMTDLINKYRLKEVVESAGYLPKAKAIETLLPSDILYFSVAEFGQYHILPGRIFDYLMSSRPIIGVVPSGSDAEKFLREYDNRIIITDSNTDMITAYIKQKAESYGSGDDRVAFDEVKCEKYSTEYMAKKYAEALNRVIK